MLRAEQQVFLPLCSQKYTVLKATVRMTCGQDSTQMSGGVHVLLSDATSSCTVALLQCRALMGRWLLAVASPLHTKTELLSHKWIVSHSTAFCGT